MISEAQEGSTRSERRNMHGFSSGKRHTQNAKNSSYLLSRMNSPYMTSYKLYLTFHQSSRTFGQSTYRRRKWMANLYQTYIGLWNSFGTTNASLMCRKDEPS